MRISPTFQIRSLILLACAAVLAAPAWADDAAIRKNIAERMPNFPKIDEITKTPIAGLYEIRVGTDVFYTDENGDHIIEGQMIATKSGVNLTDERVSKLTAVDFSSLPLKDAIVWKKGNGARKLAVFADPNCGYCKRFERQLQAVNDVTVYTFLYPVLGGDSPEKARNIWCAKNNTQVWRDWMLSGAMPGRSMGECDASAIARNLELGRKHKFNGTPALVFEDGKRVPGALPVEQLEKQFKVSSPKAG